MWLKIAFLSFLYFIQGLPYGLQDKVIPLYLRERGLSYTQLTLARFLLVPWLCKAFYAPFIDRWLTKYTWLSISIFALAITCFFGALPATQTVRGLSLVLLLLNGFCAIQDVSVDAIAINGLKESELGLANTAQVVGYKMGAICGGSFLFWIQTVFGLGGMFFGLGGFYAWALIYLVWLRVSRRSEDKKKTDNRHEVVTLRALWNTVLASKDTWSVVLFVLFYKMGEGGSLSLLPLFLVDHRVSKDTVIFWNGLVGQALSLAGSALGGALISSRWNCKSVLAVFCALRLIPMAAQAALIFFWPEEESSSWKNFFAAMSLVSLCVLQLVGGVVTTATFSLMMLCSQQQIPSLRATHYSFMASLEVVGKLVFVSFLGALVDSVGFPLVFLLLLFLMSICLIIIPTVAPTKVGHVD